MPAPTKVDFFQGDYARPVAGAQPVIQKNRYYEIVPNFSEDGAALIARPGRRYLTTVGSGPIRGIFSEEGSFDGNLFVASYDQMYRVNSDLVNTLLFTGLFDPDRGVVNMTTTAPIGDEVPEFLFFADGRNLHLYSDNAFATGSISGSPANNDVVRLGSVYYQFTNASVDAGVPAGTLANPWKVKLGLTPLQAWTSLAGAINASGTAGVDYSTALVTANAEAKAVITDNTVLTVEALAPGILGNSVITTETGVGIAWGGGTLTGGGGPAVRIVQMPADLGAVDVATLASFVFILPTQTGNFKGRIYYIEPGETTVDPLNFFTAERSPDGVNGLEVVGDLLWLPGDGSTEPWYVSQDPNARMQRLQGVVFDRGTWQGTAIAIHDALIVCDANGAVFEITGGSPKRISNPGIEEEIRRAISFQQASAP